MPTDASGRVGRPPRGRRPGPTETRQAVLAAASTRFSQDGYAGATIRKIAADAGVDASLVMQMFRSKEELFGAVMSITPTALARIADAFTGPKRGLGARVARAFLDVWEGDPADSEPLLAMLRGAITNEQAAAQLREFIEARLMTELRQELHGDPAARLRVGLASSMLVGVIVGRRLVQVPTLRDADADTLVALVAPALDAILAPRTPAVKHTAPKGEK